VHDFGHGWYIAIVLDDLVETVVSSIVHVGHGSWRRCTESAP
jgi:hypothetical protein